VLEKIKEKMQRKKARNQRVRLDGTTIIIAVNERSQRDLAKRFEGTDVDWTPIKTQFLWWENLFRQSKKLGVVISINFIENNDSSSPRTDYRGNTFMAREVPRSRRDKPQSGAMYIKRCAALAQPVIIKGSTPVQGRCVIWTQCIFKACQCSLIHLLCLFQLA
jgi:hypothetical protein